MEKKQEPLGIQNLIDDVAEFSRDCPRPDEWSHVLGYGAGRAPNERDQKHLTGISAIRFRRPTFVS